MLIHHVGCTVQSKSHFAFVRRVLNALKITFGIEKEVPKEDESCVKCFGASFCSASNHKHTHMTLTRRQASGWKSPPSAAMPCSSSTASAN